MVGLGVKGHVLGVKGEVLGVKWESSGVKGTVLIEKRRVFGVKGTATEPRGVASLKPPAGVPEEQKKSAVFRQNASLLMQKKAF